MMPIVEEQIKDLADGWSGASCEALDNGTILIVVPGVQLPTGWSRKDTTVRFLAPVGYPHAKPDCFWADGDLRLANGATPHASNTGNPIPAWPANGTPVLWFSWHVSQWNPNRDTLLTYFNAIRDRFKKTQ